jgi:hypothetical protein
MTDQHAPGEQPADPPGELDLSAWEVPPPPAGLVDAVIARARVPDRIGGIARPRAALAIAAVALVASVVALAGEAVLHGARLFVDEPATASTADLDELRTRVTGIEHELVGIRLDTVPPPEVVAPAVRAPVPVPAGPSPSPLPPPQVQPAPTEPEGVASEEHGHLVVTFRPQAILLIDGGRLGPTPWSGSVTAGKHKLTFVIGQDSYSFIIHIKPGETLTFNRDLNEP